MIFCSYPKAQYLSYKDGIDRAIQNVLSGEQYILGEQVKLFEAEFASYVGVGYALGVANGTDALKIALKALDVEVGDEVIVPSHTAVATASAVTAIGAIPVFIDIDQQYYTLDAKKIADLVTPKTKAIIAVHLYGQPADMGIILEVAKQFNLRVIEDCAQATGALYKQKRVGSMGDCGCFSFFPTKNLGAVGDGGAIVTNSNEIAEEIKKLRQYGWDEARISHMFGFNSRLDELQAAVLRIKLPHLDEDNAKRIRIAARYTQAFSEMGFIFPAVRETCMHVFHLYVLQVDNRENLVGFLKKNGVLAGIHYANPVHTMPAFRSFMRESSNLPYTTSAADRIVSLPIYPELTDSEIDTIIKLVREFYAS